MYKPYTTQLYGLQHFHARISKDRGHIVLQKFVGLSVCLSAQT